MDIMCIHVGELILQNLHALGISKGPSLRKFCRSMILLSVHHTFSSVALARVSVASNEGCLHLGLRGEGVVSEVVVNERSVGARSRVPVFVMIFVRWIQYSNSWRCEMCHVED